MIDDATHHCPSVEDLSAYRDDALAGPARAAMAAHLEQCPHCALLLRDFEDLAARLRQLRDTRAEVDIAGLVSSRLPRRRTMTAPPRWWSGVWQFAPRGLGAAGAVAAGLYLGFMLSGSGAVLRPASLIVFDAVPPGALCAGLPACSPRGR